MLYPHTFLHKGGFSAFRDESDCMESIGDIGMMTAMAGILHENRPLPEGSTRFTHSLEPGSGANAH